MKNDATWEKRMIDGKLNFESLIAGTLSSDYDVGNVSKRKALAGKLYEKMFIQSFSQMKTCFK